VEEIDMAVFYDTGGGDIYAAETKEECINAMLKDSPDLDPSEFFEVSGTTKMRSDEPPDTERVTLESQYTNLGYGYCIASENC
jgi:hypothetical protein